MRNIAIRIRRGISGSVAMPFSNRTRSGNNRKYSSTPTLAGLVNQSAATSNNQITTTAARMLTGINHQSDHTCAYCWAGAART